MRRRRRSGTASARGRTLHRRTLASRLAASSPRSPGTTTATRSRGSQRAPAPSRSARRRAAWPDRRDRSTRSTSSRSRRPRDRSRRGRSSSRTARSEPAPTVRRRPRLPLRPPSRRGSRRGSLRRRHRASAPARTRPEERRSNPRGARVALAHRQGAARRPPTPSIPLPHATSPSRASVLRSRTACAMARSVRVSDRGPSARTRPARCARASRHRRVFAPARATDRRPARRSARRGRHRPRADR